MACLWVMGAVVTPGWGDGSPEARKGERAMSMVLSSSAFQEGQALPVRFTGDGADVSPPLAWSNAPAGTQSFALICDDPDAPVGDWVHWVIYDIPATVSSLAEGVATQADLPGLGRQGRNDFRKYGYGGPTPPPGKAHRYVFTLYALDGKTGLIPGASKKDLLRVMERHILAEARLTATYQRGP
jgi:hypothetical protein